MIWIVKNCPDFYFMPSLHYDRGFVVYDDASYDCPKYWDSRGFAVLKLYESTNPTHWKVNDSYILFDQESAEAAKSLGKAVIGYSQ